ncbi:MAG: hypothetical protein H0T78_05285 [Longispora sp.]|nr:hypothetical protein [Longispora sp. (in: high G+C Gram-positive bacteria)]
MTESTLEKAGRSSTTWRAYATLAGELDALRSAYLTQVTNEESTREKLAAELSEIEQAVITQRHQLSDLHEKLDLPPPRLTCPPLEITDTVRAVRGAQEAVEVAATHLTAAETAARRSPILPYWSTNLRNTLVYGCTSMVGFFLNVTIFLASSGVTQVLLIPVLFLAMPFLAFGIGGSLIGLLFTPALGNRAPRTRPLGLAICLVPVLPLCALWSISMTLGG